MRSEENVIGSTASKDLQLIVDHAGMSMKRGARASIS